MIVISGALVLIAAVLLVLGIALPELNVVYASIGVSLLAFAFLIVGVLQRRHERPATAGEPSGTTSAPRVTPADSEISPEAWTAVRPSRAPASRTAAAAVVEDSVAGVLVVPGRPRYHVDGCRYLVDKQVEERSVATARSEGLTNCGVCDPDGVLAEQARVGTDSSAFAAEDPTEVAEAAAAVAPAKRTPVRRASSSGQRPRKTSSSVAAGADQTSKTSKTSNAAARPAPATRASRANTGRGVKATPTKTTPTKTKASKAGSPPAKASKSGAKPAAKKTPPPASRPPT